MLPRVIKHNHDFYAAHPGYFKPRDCLFFCGEQGSEKTLSAVQYVKKLCEEYPRAILCTNVEIHGLHQIRRLWNIMVWTCLKSLENGYYGVIYLIDEIHLEFNSLESKNIDIEVMMKSPAEKNRGNTL